MSEGRSTPTPPAPNGHRLEALDQVTQAPVEDFASGGASEFFSAADDPLRPEPFGRRKDAGRRQGDARGPRMVGLPGAETGGRQPRTLGDNPHVEELLATVRSYSEALTTQARADADDLLSRAQAQAEQLRVHAEAVRAEAECLRAEASALGVAVRDDAEAAREHATSAAQIHAAAEDLRATMQRDVDAARDEFERIRTEAMAIRRLLRAEVDAAVADTERTRGEYQRLWAETERVAAVLRLLSRPAGTPGQPVATGIERSAWTDAADDGVVAQRPPEAARVPPQSVPAPDVGQGPFHDNMAELLREIWEVVSADSTREHRPISDLLSRGSYGAPGPDAGLVAGGPSPAAAPCPPADVVGPEGEANRASQPLIGSGGWHQQPAAGPYAPDDVPPLPTASSRRRKRFRRE